MDLNDVERIESTRWAARTRSSSTISTGTDVTQVNVNLAGTINGIAGDSVADTVVTTGTGATT